MTTHAAEHELQQRSFANERARQLSALADKVASRPGSSARPQSQQQKDQAVASAIVTSHEATAAIQQLEHQNERQRQLAKLQLAVESRPGSSASRKSEAEPISPRSAAGSSAPAAWGDEPMPSSSHMIDDEEDWVMTKIATENHALPVVTRYFTWLLSVAVVAGLLFFLYLQLPQTGTLTVQQAVIPMGICVGTSALIFEPLCLFLIMKSRKATPTTAALAGGNAIEQDDNSEEMEMAPSTGRRNSVSVF